MIWTLLTFAKAKCVPPLHNYYEAHFYCLRMRPHNWIRTNANSFVGRVFEKVNRKKKA